MNRAAVSFETLQDSSIALIDLTAFATWCAGRNHLGKRHGLIDGNLAREGERRAEFI